MKLAQEQHDKLLSLGFKHDDNDPEYPYAYALTEDDADLEDDEYIDLVVNASPATETTFALSVCGMAFINLNIYDPEKAIEWAQAIHSVSPNY